MNRSWTEDFPHDAPSGGQTALEAEETIAALPGVASVEVTPKTDNTPNIKGNVGRTVKVALDEEFHVVDGPAVVDFLLATLWSIREGYMPNAAMDIVFTANPADEFSIEQAAIDSGWKDPGTVPPVGENGVSMARVLIQPEGGSSRGRAAENSERLGPWPGEVPNAPTGAIVPRSETN